MGAEGVTTPDEDEFPPDSAPDSWPDPECNNALDCGGYCMLLPEHDGPCMCFSDWLNRNAPKKDPHTCNP